MSYLRTFAPWIVYALFPSAYWQWAALAALLVALVVIGQQRSRGVAADALIIEIGSAGFFAVLAAVAFVAPGIGLHAYAPAAASGVLGLIAWFSLAIRRPFTLGIAKQTTDRVLWHRPEFYRVNAVITTVWAAAFTAAAVVIAVLVARSMPGTAIVQIAGFVVPMVFTVRYVAAVRKRAMRHTGANNGVA